MGVEGSLGWRLKQAWDGVEASLGWGLKVA